MIGGDFFFVSTRNTYAVVTPLRKAASYEPRIATLGIWGITWLTRDKYAIYVAVRGSYGARVSVLHPGLGYGACKAYGRNVENMSEN